MPLPCARRLAHGKRRFSDSVLEMRGEPGAPKLFSSLSITCLTVWYALFFFTEPAYDEDSLCIGLARLGSDDEKIVAGPMRKLVDVDFGPPPLPRRSGGDHPGGKRDATILHDQVVASDLQPTLFRLTVERIISRIKCFLRKITASHLNLL